MARQINPKTRSAKAKAAKRYAASTGARVERNRAELMRATQIAKVRGKDTAVQPLFGGGGKRTRVVVPGRGGGQKSKLVSVASDSLRSSSRGTSFRSVHAAQKKRRAEILRSPGAKHFNLKAAQGRKTAVRTRRQGILASRGGSTGRHRVFKRDLRGRFS